MDEHRRHAVRAVSFIERSVEFSSVRRAAVEALAILWNFNHNSFALRKHVPRNSWKQALDVHRLALLCELVHLVEEPTGPACQDLGLSPKMRISAPKKEARQLSGTCNAQLCQLTIDHRLHFLEVRFIELHLRLHPLVALPKLVKRQKVGKPVQRVRKRR